MSILSAVSKQVTQRWLGYAPLTAALGGGHVFSRIVREGFVFPAEPLRKYVTVGDKTESDVAVMGVGKSMTLTAHAWTRGYFEDETVEGILALMDAALATGPLSIVGYGNVVLRNDGLRTVIGDPEDETMRHGIVRYRISSMQV